MTLNAVIDLSHYQDVTSWSEVAADGIVAIINKCTQGLGFVDPTYAERQTAAKAAGLLWGAYHFGQGADGVQQAEYFLQHANAAPNDLLVLDFEQNTSGASMTLQQAEQFVTYVQQQRGRWPVLYGGSYLIQELGGAANSTLSSCPLWLAAYDSNPQVPPGWSAWTLWQYTDGTHGNPPYSVNGVGNCDRDQFNGTLQQLQAFWG
jgi:lysozyme